jgi:hypothetical protein
MTAPASENDEARNDPRHPHCQIVRRLGPGLLRLSTFKRTTGPRSPAAMISGPWT